MADKGRLESSDGLGDYLTSPLAGASNGAAIWCEGDILQSILWGDCELMILRHSYRTPEEKHSLFTAGLRITPEACGEAYSRCSSVLCVGSVDCKVDQRRRVAEIFAFGRRRHGPRSAGRLLM